MNTCNALVPLLLLLTLNSNGMEEQSTATPDPDKSAQTIKADDQAIALSDITGINTLKDEKEITYMARLTDGQIVYASHFLAGEHTGAFDCYRVIPGMNQIKLLPISSDYFAKLAAVFEQRARAKAAGSTDSSDISQ